MNQNQLENYGAYQKARQLFGFVVDDMEQVAANRLYERMAAQQIASADSICANIEEGYGRESSREYRQFLVIARGPARETQGRYERFGRWLPPDRVAGRVALCEEIIRIVTATIRRLDAK
jgi:four helix bundle protein